MTFRLSPGVYTFEEDRSQVISSELQSIIAQVGAFKKGPLGEKRCSTRAELYNKYTTGKIDRKFGYATYSAYNALENAKHLVIKRVVNGALYSGASIIKNGPVMTETVQFTAGSSTSYELGGKEIQAISLTGPLPNGMGLSLTMTNEISGDTVEVISAYSSTATSNEVIDAFAKLVQKQLDAWGANGKAVVNKVWAGSPRQQIQRISISRNMIQGESIDFTVEDLYLGASVINTVYADSMAETVEQLRKDLNATGSVFAYVDTTADNTLVVTALNAGPKRIDISYAATQVADEPLTVSISETQAGHGLYDDTTITLTDPDGVAITYEDVAVVTLPLDDAMIYSQISIAIQNGVILDADRQAVTTALDNSKPIMTVEHCQSLIADWAAANPFLKTIAVTSDGDDVASPKVGDTFTVRAYLSDGALLEPTDAQLTYAWTDSSGTEVLGTAYELLVDETMVGKKLMIEVNGYRNEATFTTQNVVEEV